MQVVGAYIVFGESLADMEIVLVKQREDGRVVVCSPGDEGCSVQAPLAAGSDVNLQIILSVVDAMRAQEHRIA